MKQICTTPDCTRPVDFQGLCSRCRQQALRAKDKYPVDLGTALESEGRVDAAWLGEVTP